MDLALVAPGHRTDIYQSLGSDLAAIEPPIWAGLIAEFIRRKGFSVAIVDANALGLGPEQTAREVVALNPKLAVVVVYGQNPSASTQTMPAAGAALSSLRRLAPDLKTMILGSHPSALPERTLKEEDVDFVCNGEGPYTILDLLNELSSSDPPHLDRVRGIWRMCDGKPTHTPGAPLVTDLDDEMPCVAWDLLPMERYRCHNWQAFGGLPREPYASLYTTLGCPFRCNFCCIQAPFRSGEQALGIKGNSYRLWSPAKTLEQLDLLVNRYGISNIKLADEMFVFDEDHVSGICDGIIERGYKLNIWAYARVSPVKKSLLAKLKSAGVNWLCLGIESGSSRVLSASRKGYRQALVHDVVRDIREAGINIIANFLLGLPEDDLDSMRMTLDLALQLNCEYVNIYCAMAYPGSKLYDRAVEEGWPLPEHWGAYSQYSEDFLPLPTKYLSGAEVLAFRDDAFDKYFASPGYLQLIERKFGGETLDSVNKMRSHKLKRRALAPKEPQ